MHEIEKQMKALANRRRLAIVLHLKQRGEATVGTIASAIKLSFRATSRHLGILYTVGILEKKQRSLNVSYSLSKDLHKVSQAILKALS